MEWWKSGLHLNAAAANLRCGRVGISGTEELHSSPLATVDEKYQWLSSTSNVKRPQIHL